jgi:hypothetical protein
MTKILKIERTSKQISGNGGLFLYNRLYGKLGVDSLISDCVPRNKITPKVSGVEKFKSMVMGFLSGADCLDDMDDLSLDLGFRSVVKTSASNTYGEFLRSFDMVQARALNHRLIDLSLRLRRKSHPDSKVFILDIDSTGHIQHGQKMEGLGFNYKNEWGLDSIQAFDEYGYQYWMKVRDGGTYSSNGSSEIIYEVFKKVNKRIKRYVRGDSAFCNGEFFHACFNADVKFVVAMKDNMLRPILGRVSSWRKSKDIKTYDGRTCEIASTVYYPDAAPHSLKVVVARAKKNDTQGTLFKDDKYEYFAFVTNIQEHEIRSEKIIELYRKRGNAENFIREQKNGFDLKHFPCISLIANITYGIIGAVAYNLMRYTAFLKSKTRPSFSKKLRLQLVKLPCEVISHAGYVTFRYTSHVYEEVTRLLQIMNMQFQSGL